jgi:hypothetical protein
MIEELKEKDIVTIICPGKFFGMQAEVILKRGKLYTAAIPKKGLFQTRAPFHRRDLRKDDEWTPENRALVTFKSFKSVHPFTEEMNECSYPGCKLFATTTILVKDKKGHVEEKPVCSTHTTCHGKCTTCFSK